MSIRLKLKRMAATAVAAAALLLFAGAARAVPAYTAAFDTDTVNTCPTGWTCSGGTVVATSAQFISAPYSLGIDRTTTDATILSPSFGSLAEKVTIQYWIRPGNDTPANYYNEVDLRDSTGLQAIGIRTLGAAAAGSGKFQYINSGGTWVNICATAFTPGSWYRIKLVTDPSQVSDTYDIYIYTSAGTSFCSVTGAVYRNNVNNLDKFYMIGGNTTNSEFWIDDIRITRYATLAVSAAAANPAAASVSPSATKMPVLALSLSETKLEEDVNITTLKFMASGTGNDTTGIASGTLCLYTDSGTAGQLDTLDTMLSCANYAADNATATFTLSGMTISAGSSRSWLLAQDLSGSAANGSTFITTLTPGTTYMTAYARSGYTDSDRNPTFSGSAITGNTMTVNTGDTAAPVQSAWSPAAGAYLNTATMTVTFTTGENAWCAWATSDISFASTPISNNCSGGGTTSQSCAVTNVFPEGAATVYLACRDSAFNLDSSTTNTAISYIVDLTLPVQSAWSPANAATVTTTTPTTTLTTNENATCRWALTDLGYAAMTNTCTGGGATSQSCAVTGLSQGTNAIYISCIDTAGNQNSSSDNTALSYFVDSLPPVQSAWSPATAATVTTTAPTMTFTVDEASTCRWALTDLDYASMTNACSGGGTTSQSCAATGLSQGSNTIYTSCTDSLGNADSAATNDATTYFVDSLAPTQASWSPAASSTLTVNSQAVTFTTNENATCRWALSTDLGYASMTNACTGGGTTSQTCTATGLAEGANAVYMSCVDSLANADTSTTNSMIGYTLDTTPPAKSSISPASNSRINSSSVSVTFTANETATCRWALTDLAYGGMTNSCTGGGTTSQTCPVTALTSGATNTVYISCIDAYSNADTIASNEHVLYRIDTGAPTFSGVTDVVACGTGCFNVYWSAGSDPEGSTPLSYSVYSSIISGGQNFAAPNATTASTGTQLTGLLGDTAYYIVVRASDAAGNTETNTIEITGITTAVPTLTKYTSNPVMAGDGEGFDDLGVTSPEVYYDGTTFHLWYDGKTSSTTLPGYAISLDGVNWATITGTATGGSLFAASSDPNAFDSTFAGSGRVMANPPTGSSMYYMWYGGNRADRPNTLRIGLASSNDGVNWTRVTGPADGGSIFTWSPGTFDNYMAYAPSVMYDGGLYKMWYTGTDQNVASASYFYRIGYATSTDGINWNKYTGASALGSVMDMGRYGTFDRPRATHPNVYKDGSVYKMFYSGFDSENSAVGKYRIGFAASPDGLRWTKQPGTAPGGAALDVGATYDGVIAARSSLQVINNAYHLWYDGYNGVTNQYYIMYANSAGINPPKITGITISQAGSTSVQPASLVNFSAICSYSGVNPYCGSTTCVCTDAVAWQSSNASAMTINQIGGGATAVAAGTAAVSAKCSGVTSNSITMTVDSQAPAFTGIRSIAPCGSGCLDLSWLAATDAQGSTPITYNIYRATATGTENFSSATYQTSATTTYRVTGLTNRTRYFFVVRAADTAGNEETNTAELYETPLVSDTTAPPALAYVYDGTGPGDATYTTSASQLSAVWPAASDPESLIIGYEYAIGTTAGGTTVKSWTSAGTATGVTATGLTLADGTKYYFSVRSTNEADLTSAAANSNGITVDSASPTAVIISPAVNTAVSGALTVTGTVRDTTLTSWTLYYGPGASPSLWREIASGTTEVASGTLASWTTTALGGVYTLKLIATDIFSRTTTTTNTFSLNNTVTITGAASQFEWKLVSVPCMPSNTSPIAMFGSADYKMYRWEPDAATDTYTLKYRAPSTLTAGQAVWIKPYISGFSWSYTGSQTDTTQSYTVSLKSGWNMSGVPFNRDYPWSSVKVRSGGSTYDLQTAAQQALISTTIQSFNTSSNSWSYNDISTTMTPQTGYFIRAYADIDLLFDPAQGASGGILRTTPRSDFSINISARSRNSADLDNIIAAADGASTQFDMYDAEEPPRPVTDRYVSLYFDGGAWPLNPGRYTADTRPRATKSGQELQWDMSVDTNEQSEPVTLSWDSAALPSSRYSFTLEDLSTGARTDMAAAGSYTYTAGAGAARFRITAIKLAAELVAGKLPLKAGWNLVSVPMEPENTSALSLLGGNPSVADVFQIDAGELLRGHSADVVPGGGLWVRAESDTTVDITGAPVSPATPITVNIAAGWNVVGNPYDAVLPWGDNITLNCGDGPQTLSAAIASGAVSGGIYAYNGGSYEKLQPGASLEPWRAYVIKASKSCALTLARP